MLSADTSVVAAREIVFSDLGSEIAILDLRSGEYFGLNPVGAFIWHYIQEPRTFDEICTAVTGAFEVTPERCRKDLAVLLDELRAQRLVEMREGEG